MKYLRTSDLARAVGVHPNTVRRYADRGLLPPVEHSPAGYRRFTPRHLDCLRLAWQIYAPPRPGLVIQQSAARILGTAVAGDWAGARDRADRHLALVQAERAQADLAASVLERWAAATPPAVPGRPLSIGQVTRVLGVTRDILRNWDRNGLIAIPRDPANGYRRYGAAEISRLRIIRMLSRAGYSLSAILRMLIQLDAGDTTNLRHALDTPRPDEDVYTAADRWLSTLTYEEQRARAIIALVDAIFPPPAPPA
jgi:DNA-binding transcriptional MerR regulator